MHCAPCTPKKKTFHVVENGCLQCVDSIFVNLPQFAKSGLKESINRFFCYFSLHLFGYFGLVSSLFVSVSVCFTAALSMAAPPKRTVGRPRRRGSPKYIRPRESVFLISGEMGKKLLAVNPTDSVFVEFLLHRMFNCKQRSREDKLKAKQASQSNMNKALFNLTYEASDILNVSPHSKRFRASSSKNLGREQKKRNEGGGGRERRKPFPQTPRF